MSGPECCSNPPTLNPTGGGGSVIELAGLQTYVTGPSDSKLAILLVSDAFGFEAPKLRRIADKAATAGFYVVVPDFFHGEPYDPNNPDLPVAEWVKKHTTDNAVVEAKPVIEALRSKGVSAIGAAGLCWGGKVAMELAKSDYVQAAVLLHPALITTDDIKESKVPISVLGAETDVHCPPELVKQFGEILSSKSEVGGHVKIFPGTGHGWALRYKDEDVEAVKRAEEAHQDMLDWFIKHVK